MSKSNNCIVAPFPSLEHADSAMLELLEAGFAKEDLGFIIREDQNVDLQQSQAHDRSTATHTAEGGVGGGIVGGVLGSLVAAAIPGFGAVLSAGLLAAAGGAIAGSFAALMRMFGLSDEELHSYRDVLDTGRPVIAIRTRDKYLQALDIVQQHGGYDITQES